MTEYTKKAVVGSFLVLLFTVIAAIFGYLLRVIIARTLSPVEFGLIYSLISTFGLFSVFQYMGLNDAIVKYIVEFRIDKKWGKIKSAILFTISSQLLTAFILSAIFWILAPYLAEHYFRSELAVSGLRLTAVFFFLLPIENLFLSIFQGYQKPLWYSSASLARMVFIFVCTLILFNFSKTIFSPLIAYTLVYLLSFCIYLPYFLKKIFPDFFKVKIEKFKQVSKKLLLFGLPVMITSFAATIITYTDTIMITYFKTLNDVAVYNAVIPTAGLLWFFGSAMAIILLPLSSEMWKRKHSHLMEEGVNLLYKYGIIVIIPLAVLMFTYPELILRLLFGLDYSTGANVLRILSVAALFFTIGQINTSILSGMGKPKLNAKITLIAALFNVAGNFVLIPKLGITGAAISTAIAFGLISVISAFKLRKEVNFSVPWIEWTKTAVCASVFLITLILLKNIIKMDLLPKITICLIMGLAVYILMVLLTKNLTIDEIKKIKHRIR